MSVIVPALDAEGLSECLTSLRTLQYPSARHEILVVGATSSQKTAEIAAAYPVIYLHADRRSVSVARNLGIEQSRGEIVAFTDPDCVVTTSWLGRLVEGFSHPLTGAVAGSILPYPPVTLAERYMARRRSHTQERPLSHPRRPYAMTPNLAFRRAALAAIGLFDTRFPGGGWEDADLCWRLAEHSHYRLEYEPRAAIFHRYRSTVPDFLVQQYRYGYGLGVLCRKYEADLPLEWRQRAGSPADLVRALGALVGTGRSVGEPERAAFRFLDLLRQVGQRSGYWAACLASTVSRRSSPVVLREQGRRGAAP